MTLRLIHILFIVLSPCIVLSQESPPSPSDNANWISSISYTVDGQTLSKGVSYFNALGKGSQSLLWDINSNKVWATEILYDLHGRPAFQTLSAPIDSGANFSYDSQFILDSSNEEYTTSDFDATTYFQNNPKKVGLSSKLGQYFWNYSGDSSYDYYDNTRYPFVRTVYSKLNPGASKKVIGRNKIEDQWKQTYSFSMPAGTELSTFYAFGNLETQYDTMQITKTVSRDVHGVEAVIFTDSEGNTLAAARSGNTSINVQNIVEIRDQKFVDIHIPTSCSDISIINPDNVDLRIYDLITENHETYIGGAAGTQALGSGFYRIAVRFPDTYEYDSASPIQIIHDVNYYDYALNYYDISGRLLKSTQPKSKNLKSEFVYNSLGQVLESTNSDEGEAKFIYRKDGQIRFSQNTKQLEASEFSYTNYDNQARPIESGVYSSNDILFYLPNPGVEDTEETPSSVTQSVTPAQIQSISQPNHYTFVKDLALEEWNAGFTSQEQIEAHGEFNFKTSPGHTTPFEVIVGLSEVDATFDATSNTPIKYGIYLVSDGPLKEIRVHQSGGFVRNPDNSIQVFGTFTASDTFRIERDASGVINYIKNNDAPFYTVSDGYLLPLKVYTSFKYTNDTINDLFIINHPTIVETTDIDIQDLIDTNDGLVDGNCKEQSFTLYDIPDSGLNSKLKNCGLPTSAYKQTFMSGNVSKTFTKKPETNTTWYSYDVYGRVKWLIQETSGLDCLKTIDYTYDPISGQVIKVDYQRHSKTERFIHRYTYNTGGQLLLVETSETDEEVDYKEQAAYKYNESGQLIRTELAENLQGIDYIYNLNGQLKAINNPSLTTSNDPGGDGPATNGFIRDVFGMAIQYYNGDYTRSVSPALASISPETDNQFNGNIQAIQWQNQNGGVATYSYGYNKNNWLQEAKFSHATAVSEDYNVNNITYDANGNLLTLKRNGHSDSGSNSMDDFTYDYNFNTNQLNHVLDTNDNVDETRYNDLKSQDANNYIYNGIGQLSISKQDKAIYEYNASGLVSKISEISDTETSNLTTLLFEDYETFNGLLVDSSINWNVVTGLQRISIAPQADFTDSFYTDGLEPIDDINYNIPDYCMDFHPDDNPYKSRLQFNFFQNSDTAPNPYLITTNLETVPDAFHKLSFDLFLFQKQVLASLGGVTETAINAGATITLTQQDGTVIQTIVIDPQDYTESYCDRILEHINFDFVASSNTVNLKIDINNDGSTTSYAHPRQVSLYQSAEVDNVHLQIASNTKLAFAYNDRGQRVRKEVYMNTGDINATYYVRDAAGSPIAIYNRLGHATLSLKENPVYGANRIGVYYRSNSTKEPGDYLYQLTDHLGNVRAVITRAGTSAYSLTNETDYYPFGMPMPNRNVEGNYRYKFQGQEKDPETGMEAFELRLWDSRIGRWLTTDPARQFSSPYLGMGNNPINGTDPDGGEWFTKYKLRGGNENDVVEIDDGVDITLEVDAFDYALAKIFKSEFDNFDTVELSSDFSLNKAYIDFFSDIKWNKVDATQLGFLDLFKSPELRTTNIQGGVSELETWLVPGGGGLKMFKPGYKIISRAFRTGAAFRIGKASRFTEFGYQLSKHASLTDRPKPAFWRSFLTEGAKLSPKNWNQAGLDAFRHIIRNGKVHNTGKFYDIRLPSGRGIRLQHDFKFKGFLD